MMTTDDSDSIPGVLSHAVTKFADAIGYPGGMTRDWLADGILDVYVLLTEPTAAAVEAGHHARLQELERRLAPRAAWERVRPLESALARERSQRQMDAFRAGLAGLALAGQPALGQVPAVAEALHALESVAQDSRARAWLGGLDLEDTELLPALHDLGRRIGRFFKEEFQGGN